MTPIKIVLTGGPCAGKTTALVRINDHFTQLGYKVFTIPEVPTMVSQAGWSYLTDNHQFLYEGEKTILQTQIALEDHFVRIAETCTEPSVIVCDRGVMDISAYLDPQLWQELLDDCGVDAASIHERYDAVLHLVSAADGAEEFYTTATNAQRYEKADAEGLAIARMLDKKVMNAWTGHRHLRVIDNRSDFESKLQHTLREISKVLGLPHAALENRKYIVEVCGELPESINSHITQTYLVAEPDTEVRLRSRMWGAKRANILLSRKHLSDGQVVITERQVTNPVYESLLQQADPYRHTIYKNRKSFIWQGQYFELDIFEAPHDGLIILEAKGTELSHDVTIPPFLQVVEDITNNTKFYNHNLAKN